MQLRIKHQMFGKGKQSELDTGCEATGIGDVTRAANASAVQFRQSIDEIVFFALQPIVHAEVDDFDLFRDGVAFHELPCISMRRTEKEHIDVT